MSVGVTFEVSEAQAQSDFSLPADYRSGCTTLSSFYRTIYSVGIMEKMSEPEVAPVKWFPP